MPSPVPHAGTGNPADNPNAQLTVSSAMTALGVSIVMFVLIQATFEYTRFYKQIHLKRMQKRFQEIGRVPPAPPNYVFGWLVATQQQSENDILRMVGLDAYMLLRYITICFKSAVFMSFWGVLILVPIYSTAGDTGAWNTYTLSNVIQSNDNNEYRLWAAAIFAYLFSAYFCQLLYAEYGMFSSNRLKYLVQADPDSPQGDPDTPPQKYFTVMVERIPGHLRSAVALHKFFENLFPGEVYTVEIALDLTELNRVDAKRKEVRDRLEAAIAFYEATGCRPQVYVQTGNFDMFVQDKKKKRRFSDAAAVQSQATNTNNPVVKCLESATSAIQQYLAPELFGFENKDALTHYADKLEQLNNKCEQMQLLNYDFARKCDKDLERKIRNRHDTRAAVLMQTVTKKGTQGLQFFRNNNIETLLFGPEVEDIKTVADNEMLKVEVLNTMSSPSHDAGETTRPSSRRPSAESAASSGRDIEKGGGGAVLQSARRRSTSNPDSMNTISSATANALSSMSLDLGDTDSSGIPTNPLTDYDRSQFTSFVSPEEYLRAGTNALVAIHSITNAQTSSLLDESTLENVFKSPVAAISPSTTSGEASIHGNEGAGGGVGGSSHGETEEDGNLAAAARMTLAMPPIPPKTPKTPGRSSGSFNFGNVGSAVTNPMLESASASTSSSTSSSGVISPTQSMRPSQPAPGSSSSSAAGVSSPQPQQSTTSPPQQQPQTQHTRSSSIKPFSHPDAQQQPTITSSSSPSPSMDREDEIIYSEIKAVGGGERSTGTSGTVRRPSGATQRRPSSQQEKQQQHEHDDDEEDRHSIADDIKSSVINPMHDLLAETTYAFMTPDQIEKASEIAKIGAQRARVLGREGWEQTKNATSGAWKGLKEVERAAELLLLGAFNKYSTTAFVTFNSRVTESIAQQMLLSHESMEITHAPNPKDVIWENVAIPRSQIQMRSFIVNVGLCVGSLFWSSLVNAITSLGQWLGFSQFQQQYFSVVIMLGFLFSLPVFFDYLARNYEGMKLESDIQNSIMQRYFYYQLVNVYVTVGLGTEDIFSQLYNMLRHPQYLVNILSKTVPSVSLYFMCLTIVKIFVALPAEIVRPYQLSTITVMQTLMDKRKCTRRDLRTGAFFPWPMLYGWVYPQLMLVLIIQLTYACIAPAFMPLCALFFAFAYIMYKFQLLYVYVNDYQSGGTMWYDVFTRSLIALWFSSITLLGYLSLELQSFYSGPFYFLLPLPFGIMYFYRYTEDKFKKQSMNLPLEFAKELDIRNRERSAQGRPVPHDVFTTHCYRQPALTEKAVYPEPFRDASIQMYTTDATSSTSPWGRSTGDGSSQSRTRRRRGSLSLDINECIDDGEHDPTILRNYYEKVVLPLAHPERYGSSV